MRPALASLLMLAGCAAANTPPPPQAAGAAPAGTPVASGPAQIWRGALRCAPIPGIASLRLNQPIEVTVTGNAATYDRAVRRGDTGGETDIHERGGGTVAPDGSVTLTGQASAPAYRYSAQYSGMLQPDGGTSRLTGKQLWYPQRANPVDRNCSMTLRRDG